MSRGRAAAIEMRIEDLAEASGATVRNIRVYQEKGLLPAPERKGRSAVYGAAHLERLHVILRLLDRGYTFATIDELFVAERMGLSLSDLIEAENPRAARRVGTARWRRYSRGDAEKLAGFRFSEQLVKVGAEGGLVEDPRGEQGFITDQHMYVLFRDLVALGMTQSEIDGLATTVFAGQQLSARGLDALLTAVERRPEYTGDESAERVHELMNGLLPRSGAAVRVIFQAVAEQRVREYLEGRAADPAPEPPPGATGEGPAPTPAPGAGDYTI